jgi:hypothetical protein
MVKKILLMSLLLVSGVAAGQQRPAGLSVYTWTREDIFAGVLANNIEQLNVGLQKLDAILKENPKDPDALAMKGLGIAVMAVRDQESGNATGFKQKYTEALRLLDQGLMLDPKGGGVNAVYGGTMLLYIDRLPQEYKERSLAQARSSYSLLYATQEAGLDQMPTHHKGELLGGMAEVEQRLGNRANAEKYLKRIVDTMPNTPYAGRARLWLSDPEVARKNSKFVCQSCHDPGRLKNRVPGGQ